ncbi:MAG: response regulator transcription factor [Roseivirga sp.]|nr:response regulator transcription factor [Roseivirga sp.]
MRVLILEDEHLAAEKLIMLLEEAEPDIEVAAVIESVKNAIVWLADNQADLIFMDIHLSDDLSFKIFDAVQVSTPIIFTTAYDEYAIRAFDQNSLAYLLKPIESESLSRALDKYHRYSRPQQDVSDSLKLLLSSYTAKNTTPITAKKRVMVSYGGKMQTVLIQDVACFYTHDRAVYLVTKTGKRYVVDDSLEKVETWTNPEHFFRVNRQYLVHIEAVAEALQYSARKLKVNLTVDTPDLILVPTDKITRFKQWLNT